MNNLNERNERLNDLAVIGSRTTGERIEIFPGFFVAESIPYVELTCAGELFLRELCNDYMNEKLTVAEVISNIDTISCEYSGYSDMVSDAMWYELNKLLEN